MGLHPRSAVGKEQRLWQAYLPRRAVASGWAWRSCRNAPVPERGPRQAGASFFGVVDRGLGFLWTGASARLGLTAPALSASLDWVGLRSAHLWSCSSTAHTPGLSRGSQGAGSEAHRRDLRLPGPARPCPVLCCAWCVVLAS